MLIGFLPFVDLVNFIGFDETEIDSVEKQLYIQ
jgi:hypothetical protein